MIIVVKHSTPNIIVGGKMRRYNLQSLFGKRKTLYLSLGIMLISVLSLTVVYAALSQVLNISGSTEIAASNWDIYLDNVIVRTGSVSANAPSISGNNNLSFTANLKRQEIIMNFL